MKPASKTKPKIVRYTSKQLKRMKSETDWARIDAMKDEDIDYSDIPETDEQFWATAKLIQPAKKPVSLRLDQDIINWFKHQKVRYQTLMNQVLRQYMNAQKRKTTRRSTK